jgi:hypothetical protein
MKIMLGRSLFRKEIRENTLKFLFGVLLLGALALIITTPAASGPYPQSFFSRQDNLPGMETNLDKSPETAQKTLFSHFWKQWNSKGLALAGILVSIILGAGVFAQEKAKGTLFFLASTPLSRRNIYDTKVAAGLVLLFACIIGTTLLLILFTSFYGISLPVLPFVIGAFSAFCGLAVIYQVTIIFSILTDDPLKAGAASAFLSSLLSIPGLFEGGQKYSLLLQMQSRNSTLEEPFSWFFFLLMAALFFALRHLGLWLCYREEI